MRGRDLTNRMPRHPIRPNTPRLHQPIQRHLKRENRRLRNPSGQRSPSITPTSNRDHTSSNTPAKTGNLSANSPPIPARWLPCPVNRNANPTPGRSTPRNLDTIEHHRTMPEHRPRHRQRKPHVQRIRMPHVTRTTRELPDPPHLLTQRLSTLRRNNPRHNERTTHTNHTTTRKVLPDPPPTPRARSYPRYRTTRPHSGERDPRRTTQWPLWPARSRPQTSPRAATADRRAACAARHRAASPSPS